MKYLKLSLTILFSVLTLVSIWAVTFETFPLGCYSYLLSSNANDPYTLAQKDDLCGMMSDMGYNIIQIVNDRDEVNSTTTLSNLLDVVKLNGLNAIVHDRFYPFPAVDVGYSNHNYHSTVALTTSSYLKLEAEYSGSSDIDGGTVDDKWYCSGDEFGGNMPRRGDITSNGLGYAWKCTRGLDNPGYAYTDIRWRWQHSDSTACQRFGDEFRIFNSHSTSYNYKFLYIKYKVKIGNFVTPDLPDTTVLFSFQTMGYRGGTGTADSVVVNHKFLNYNHSNLNDWTTDYCYGDFEHAGSPTGYFDIEIKVSYADLMADSCKLLTDDIGNNGKHSWWQYKLANLNPRVLWKGNCDLSIDYIEIEDHLHRSMVNDTTAYKTNINARINYITDSLSSGEIVKYMYGFDEPNLGQFDSYNKVQRHIYTDAADIHHINPQLITAAYDTYYNKIPKTGGGFYDHVKSFRSKAVPNVMAPDMYPIVPGINYNNPEQDELLCLQRTINDKLLKQYKDSKQYCNLASPSRPFIPIVQAMGAWKDNQWQSWALPPYETQKMLQFLPLCYGADGILDYKAIENITDTGIIPDGQYSAIISYSGTIQTAPTFTRIALTEANQKVGVYGQTIKYHNLEWVDAGCMRVDSEPADLTAELSGFGLNSLRVAVTDNDVYQGYIQCGFYRDPAADDSPYFMLVNRRTNKLNTTGGTTSSNCPPAEYSTRYQAFGSQDARFVTNSAAHTQYGTYVALYDSLAGVFWRPVGEAINVTIAAGDGKLVEMVGSLPASVDTTYTLSSKVILEGHITLNAGANVSVATGTEMRVKAGTMIDIFDGASFTFRGNVVFEDNVLINADQNSLLNFENANCTWGSGAVVYVVGGELNVSNSSWDKSTLATSWEGISANLGSVVTLSNSVLSNAFQNTITNSDLYVTSCRFDVPAITGAIGLSISNTQAGYHSEILTTEANMGFYSSTGSAAIGILLGEIKNRVIIVCQAFQDLSIGISKVSNIYAADSIAYSTFTNCATGFKTLCSGYKGKIEQCSFMGNNRGIWLRTASPCVNACSFEACTSGIFAEYSPSKTTASTGIFASTFTRCDVGVESRNASYKVKNNLFDMNKVGILNHEDSNLNLSYNSQNVMKNTLSNIEFCGLKEDPYQSKIQMYTGHNDFYHEQDLESGFSVKDFTFDSDFNSGLAMPSFIIDATMNWFQDCTVRVNKDEYEDYVYVGEFDSEPNVPLEFGEERFLMALGYEAQGNYVQAIAIFKSMLDEELESEKLYLTSAADGVYRLSNAISDPAWVATAYLAGKISQYSTSDSTLSALLKNYQTKVFVSEKDYQNAINNIQLRISTPVSELDSLLAVLDLEIVLQLAAMEESKRPLATMYAEYKYPDVQTFERKHEEHWAELYRLLNKGDEPTIPIPSRPVITSNYPNPFNPSTTLTFSVPKKGFATLSVYNLKGQKVKQLIDGELAKGHHKIVWDGVDENKKPVASGIYFIRLEAGNQTNVHKVMLMK